MAIYIAHLGTGSTLLCRSIRAATIRNYSHDIAKFHCRFPRWSDGDVFSNNPRYYLHTNKEFAPCIKQVLDELERWEKVPDCREPFTIAMWDELNRLADKHPPDTLWPVCRNFFGCGLYGGFRLTEWAQPDANSDLSTPALAPTGVPRAFCLDDIEFRAGANSRIPLDDALLAKPDAPARVLLTFSWQKNGNHGEQRLFVDNTTKPEMSFTRLMQRIVQRAVRLVGRTNTIPLCVYRTDSGEIRLVTAAQVALVMQTIACRVYNLDPVKHKRELSRWTSHSLRVGACVTLHAMGFTDTQIQFLLHWRSLTFLVYLRNLAILARKQNQAMADLSVMPNVH